MLELRGVTKAFGDRRVLDDVTMELPPGTVVGFVGANGAGKTTTMRIIMGLLEPDNGHITWRGDPLTPAKRRTFGYMPEERGLYPKQAIGEQLVYFGRLHGMSAQEATGRAAELLKTFGLHDRSRERLEQLSLGNQQRVQVAVSLMHRPQLLVLDEPFSGLDPEAIEAMGELIRDCSKDGIPVLFSSHQLDLVERLCDELVILHAGRVVAAGRADALRAEHETLIRVDAPAVGTWITECAGVETRHVETDSAIFTPVDADAAQALLRRALNCGPVTHFGQIHVPLSDIYKEVTCG